jgi:hypothetical protein
VSLDVTPASAGWTYVGFEVLRLAPGQAVERYTGDRELCVVVVAGHAHVASEHGEWRDLGTRDTPFAGRPDAAYLPPRTRVRLEAAADGVELGLCSAPSGDGAEPRVLPADAVEVEIRGHGALERTIHPILMGAGTADSLLVCEVLTRAATGRAIRRTSTTATRRPRRPSSRRPTTTVSNRRRGSRSSASIATTARSTCPSRSAMVTSCSCRAATTRSPRRPGTTSTT